MRKLMVIGILAFALVACGPKPQDYAQADLIAQQAEAARIANEYQSRINEQEIQIRATAAAAELSARLAEIDARRESEIAASQAKVRLLTAGSYGLVAVLVAIAVGVCAVGGAMAYGISRRAISAGGLTPVPMDRLTRLPRPVIVGSWLVNPGTGEILSLRDQAGIDRFRASLQAQTTQVALLARSAERIGRRDGQAAGTLPGIGGNVRAVLPAEDEHHD